MNHIQIKKNLLRFIHRQIMRILKRKKMILIKIIIRKKRIKKKRKK